MKKTILLTIAIVLIGLNSFAQWTAQSSNLPTTTLTSVYFSDTDNGHAVGFGTDPPMPYLNTINGGATWTSVGLTGIDAVNSVFFTDINTGYSAGMVSGTDQHFGIIQKTIDGGMTWTGVFVGSVWSSFNSVFFTDINTGYVVGGDITNVNTNGIILKTINGGNNWTIVLSGSIPSLTSVFFIDAYTGFAVGYGGTILKTIDGGNTWSDESVFTTYDDLYSVYFTDDDTGYAVGFHVNPGSPGNGIILSTTDGGITWTTTELGSFILHSVFFPDANTGYVVGGSLYVAGGIILKTIDAGSTWVTQESGTVNNLNSVFFSDTNTGYAVGEGGTILKTINGGGTVGINEPQNTNDLINSLKIYPNPATEYISIEIPESGSRMKGTVSVYGMAGQLLIQGQVQDSKSEINVFSLPKGIYFVRLINEEKINFGKFLKE
jgi:photosystem II stability/assembly factor-like uncharacterized protein